MAIVTLSEAKSYMGVTTTAHDTEILRYCNAAQSVIETMTSPRTMVRRQFVERHPEPGTILLRRTPVVTIDSVGFVQPLSGIVTPLTGLTPYVVNSDSGKVYTHFGNGPVEVTYTAGLSAVPDEAVDAALVYVSYRYRRNHGGSESYMPAGVDGSISPPMGTKALRDQLLLALGTYAQEGVVA